MSRRDIWGVVMLVVTIIGAIGGAQSGVSGGEWATYFFGCAIVYWIGTGFFKDKVPPDEKDGT